MQKRMPLKNHVEEIQLITGRVMTALILMSILIILLCLRLAYLQLLQHDLYTTLSKKNWLDLVPVEPTRGLIFDRNGVLLAENVPVFSVDIIPDKIKNMPQTLSEISKIIPLTDTDIVQFQKQLKQHRRFDAIPLKLRLTEEEVAKLAETQYRLPGVTVKARLMRHYPFGESFIHVLGYVGRINTKELEDIDTSNYSASNYIGKLGIEKFYEEELHGSVGFVQVENDARGEAVRTVSHSKPIPGENLYLTIDSQLQLAAEKALAGHRGSIVAIQPSTGQILAMVSQPAYDPNAFVAGISTLDFKSLQLSPSRPLYNRALRGLYPPASTLKPYIALQGLNTGFTDTHSSLFDPGWYQLKNSSRLFHDWKRHGHGTVNLTKAISNSCDIFFYDLAFRMGIQRMDAGLNLFGFGQLTGVDLGEEVPGVLASPEWKKRVKGNNWYPGDTINSGIGQGFMQTTPLQLAHAVSTLAMRGKRFAPYLLLASQEPGKSAIEQRPNLITKIKLADEAYWDVIIHAMEAVLKPGGTGFRHWKEFPYTAAAKTGTAQVYSKKHYDMTREHDDQDALPEHLRDNSLMIAFAPVDHPQIAVAVVVENSLMAAKIAKNVIDYYILGPTVLTENVSPIKEEETLNDVH